MHAAYLRDRAQVTLQQKELEAVVRRARADNIPNAYKFTGTADPFRVEEQTMLLDRPVEDQKKLCPPYPAMTLEAIKMIVDSFGVGEEQDDPEKGEAIRLSLDHGAEECQNLNINEIFTDKNSKARLGLDAINFPAGQIHPQADWTQADKKMLLAAKEAMYGEGCSCTRSEISIEIDKSSDRSAVSGCECG